VTAKVTTFPGLSPSHCECTPRWSGVRDREGRLDPGWGSLPQTRPDEEGPWHFAEPLASLPLQPRCESPSEHVAGGSVWVRSPSAQSNIQSAAVARFAMRGARLYRMRLSDFLHEVGVNVANLTWVIVAIGALVGGPIIMFGYRRGDQNLLAFGQIHGVLKQDWTRTGNIEFQAVELDERSSPQPLRLLVEERRVTESAVGQNIAELRWRLATLEEGKQLVVYWNARQT
jgi:hypothetical protein